MARIFSYEGRDSDGNVVRGKLDAERIDDILPYLKEHNITPLNILEINSSPISWNKWRRLNFGAKKIAPFHIMNLCRQLAALNDAGLPLVRALNKLSQSSSVKELRSVLVMVSNDIAAGMTLSNAFKKHPQAFSEIVIHMVEIGENTGNLSESLAHLSRHIKASIANHNRLISAIRYPLLVIVVATAAILVMNILVIPKFAEMFSKYHVELPWATRMIIVVSNFIVKYKFILLGLFVIMIFLFNRIVKIPGVRYLWDRYKLYLPVFGSLQRRVIISQFAWTFSLILKSGIPILKGLDLASRTVDNSYFGAKLIKMRSDIEHGETLSRAVAGSELFTPIAIQMIEIGEESQKLDDTLYEIARYYDADIDYDLRRLNELIEPILLAALGGVVLVLALGVYFPMWDLIKVAQI